MQVRAVKLLYAAKCVVISLNILLIIINQLLRERIEKGSAIIVKENEHGGLDENNNFDIHA